MKKLNRDIVALTRESRGLTQIELADLLKVEQGTISKLENNKMDATNELVSAIAVALNYPQDIFYLEEMVIRVEGHYRKKITLPVKDLKRHKANMTLNEWRVNILSNAVDLPRVNIPSWDLEMDGSIKDGAKYVREYWRIPRGRIEDIASVLEDNGVVIVPMDLGDMDGLSTFSAKYNIPIIYVNKTRPADRIRFTLAHEASHYILHFGRKHSDEDEDRIEREANDFASELLMPTDEIRPQLIGLNMERLGDLKRYWKVSMAAILVKAGYIDGVITPNQKKYLWMQMSRLGYKQKEPFEITRDKITLFNELLEVHINDMGYTKDELASNMYMSVDEMNTEFFGERKKVKLQIRK